MPRPKYVTTRRDENASGTGALDGRQEKPTHVPGAASELRATEIGQGILAWPTDFKLRKSPRCRSSERGIHANRRGYGGGAGGWAASTHNGWCRDGRKKSRIQGAGKPGVLSEEHGQEIPNQVNNTSDE